MRTYFNQVVHRTPGLGDGYDVPAAYVFPNLTRPVTDQCPDIFPNVMLFSGRFDSKGPAICNTRYAELMFWRAVQTQSGGERRS